MIARVVHPYNLQKALEHVIANKGNAGVDAIKTAQLKEHFPARKTQLLKEIAEENYLPQPILGVEPSDSEHMNTKKTIILSE